MATRGRRPKPTLLHELHGTINSTRHAARVDEIQAPGDPLLDPPDFLTEGQKASWRYAIEFAPVGLLKPIDRTALIIWVEADDRLRRAIVAQAQHDQRHPAMQLLTPRRRGGDSVELVEAPYLKVIARASETLLRAMTELGFSPAARPRIANPGAKPATADNPESPWTRLKVLQGGKGSGAT